jgi:Tn3 transposase DDE domain
MRFAAPFLNRLGEIRDRSYENQSHQASGLNLLVAAIILWNTTYRRQAIDHLIARDTIPQPAIWPTCRHSAGSTFSGPEITHWEISPLSVPINSGRSAPEPGIAASRALNLFRVFSSKSLVKEYHGVAFNEDRLRHPRTAQFSRTAHPKAVCRPLAQYRRQSTRLPSRISRSTRSASHVRIYPAL